MREVVKRSTQWPVAALCLLLLSGCGDIVVDPVPPDIGNGPFLRVYANDAAAGDSLRKALVFDGVQFWLQPGKVYSLSLQGAAYDKRTLQLYRFDSNRRLRRDRSIREVNAGAMGSYFELTSPQAQSHRYVARLDPPGNEPLTGFSSVRLRSALATGPDTLKVRLIFVNQLTDIATVSKRADYAKKFFATLSAVFQQANIPIQGSFEWAGPESEFTTVTWSNLARTLPGSREIGHVHIYLVENIKGPSEETVLGFAPREAADMDWSLDSRVILSNQITDAAKVGVTAAHEIGHFFGLRHTVATRLDMEYDRDLSNRDDGFDDTPFCEVESGIALAKIATTGEDYRCMRVAADACSRSCQLSNLMHPFECGGESQIMLSSQQIKFLRTNIALYQR